MSKQNDNEKFDKALKALEGFFPPQKMGDAKKVLKKLKGLYEGPSAASKQNSESYDLPDLKGKSADYYGFSDGACRGNPGPGAWGIVVQDAQGTVLVEQSAVEAQTTNNRMELMGAIKSMEYILDQGGASMCLVSDSRYVLGGLESWLASWKKRGWKKADKKEPENIDLWRVIDELQGQFSSFTCHWVKGHAGHAQNERCDALANEALDAAGY